MVPPPGRKDESEKLKKSEDETAEGVLLALVNSKPENRQVFFWIILELKYNFKTKYTKVNAA